ncbi:hypothetical protein FRC10_009072, partial [Ceratobasidium sp. 414]
AKHPEGDEARLLSTSTTLVPQKWRRQWCLRRDSVTYHNDLNSVKLTGDQEAIREWSDNRRREVDARWKNAQPLVAFINRMEAEQSGDLATRKEQRQEEVESRLLKLGWEEGDFEMREKLGMKQWKSLVCVAKPLTERDWEKILPQLTTLLERNRELRLEAEALTRHRDRESKIRRWLSGALRQLEPYAILGESQPKHEETMAFSGPTQSLIGLSEDPRTLKAPHPTHDQVIVSAHFQQLLTTDVPMEDFELALAAMRPTLETMMLEWRVNLERHLIELLPSGDDPTDEGSQDPTQGTEASIPSNQILDPSILVNGQPMANLSLGVRRLLRADVIFDRGFPSPQFYPDSFAYLWATPNFLVYKYNEEVSKMSKALLASLGHPNAAYLQMKALGSAFSCGRCISRNCTTWRELLGHYIREREKWDITQKHKSFKKGKITYIFTHDTEVQGDRPLMRMASEEEGKTPYKYEKYENLADVVDHVRNSFDTTADIGQALPPTLSQPWNIPVG